MSRPIFSCVAAVAALLVGALASAQQRAAKETIPQDLPTEVRSLLEQCRASAASARGGAAEKLGELKEKAGPAVPFLISMLGDDVEYSDSITVGGMTIYGNTSPGRKAAVALGRIGSEAIEPLLKVLQDVKGPNRDKAAVALGIAKDPRAVPPLIEALADKDARLRREAASALGSLKDERAVAPLIGALSDADEAVPRAAQEALEELTAQKFGKDRGRWEQWWQTNKKQ
jgi:HEAT repeat protein